MEQVKQDDELLLAPVNAPRQNETRTNLIVNYLPQSIRDDELFALFAPFGPLAKAKVVVDRNADYSRGFGFVEYERPEDAARAIAELNRFQVQNKQLKVSYSRPNTASIKDTNLYVTNLGPNASEELLDKTFGPFGQILQKRVLYDQRTGRPRGVGFVRYARTEDAAYAIRELDGTVVEGSDRPLSVRLAEDHGKQKASYYARYVSNKAKHQEQQHQRFHGMPEGIQGQYGGWGRGMGRRFNRYDPITGSLERSSGGAAAGWDRGIRDGTDSRGGSVGSWAGAWNQGVAYDSGYVKLEPQAWNPNLWRGGHYELNSWN